MGLQHLEKDSLVPGRSLGFDVVDASGRVLLPKGTPVADEAQSKILWTRGFQREGAVVPIVVSIQQPFQSAWRQRPKAVDAPSNAPKFFQSVERLSFQLEEIFSELLNGKGSQLPERILEIARSIQTQAVRDADAMLAAMELSANTRYGTLHALHSAALCELVAGSQGVSADSRRTLVAAALTRDVGFLELQDELDRQTDPLSEEQQDRVRSHPLASAQLLKEAGVRDQAWIAAVEQHH